jgi:hypothetical protein
MPTSDDEVGFFMPIGDGSHGLIPVIHQIIHYPLDIQCVANDELIRVRFGFIRN